MANAENAPPTAKTKPKTITIFVNNRAIELPEKDATGLEIKQAAQVPGEFKLYDQQGNEVRNDQSIKVHPKERFTAISGQDVS